MNAPSVKSVKPVTKRRLLVTFVNRIQKIYGCNGIMHLDRFRLLQNEAFFKMAAVDPGGYGVSWNDEIDLSEYELWNNGLEIGTADTLVDSRDIPEAQGVGKRSGVFVHTRCPS